jgi:Holliday junction DNA helicase RuvA
MIGRLRGILEMKQPPLLLIDVAGVGYECQAPMSTIYQLPEIGSPINLLIHFHVREDAQILYGFFEEKERALFRALIKVSGVGPKMALTILSGIEAREFIQCVDRRDIAPLVRLPGVGKKTAERLVIEMAGRLAKSIPEEENFSRRLFESVQDYDAPKLAEEEAIGALIALGYKPQEATRAIGKVMVEGATSQDLIRKALQNSARV